MPALRVTLFLTKQQACRHRGLRWWSRWRRRGEPALARAVEAGFGPVHRHSGEEAAGGLGVEEEREMGMAGEVGGIDGGGEGGVLVFRRRANWRSRAGRSRGAVEDRDGIEVEARADAGGAEQFERGGRAGRSR